MIVEMRTYTLKPGSQPTVIERFGKALPNRLKLGPIAAFWSTDVGPLNQIIHVWTYADSAERDKVRAAGGENRIHLVGGGDVADTHRREGAVVADLVAEWGLEHAAVNWFGLRHGLAGGDID